MPSLTQRLQNAWNAFRNPRDPTFTNYGLGTYYRPDRHRFSHSNERSIVTTIFNRIAVDCAAIDLEHVRLDEDGRYTDTIKSGLNDCLTYSANIDQTGKAFIEDIVQSMFDEGVVAVVPVDTTSNPYFTSSYDTLNLPSINALAFEDLIIAWAALGLTPVATYFFTVSPASSDSGCVPTTIDNAKSITASEIGISLITSLIFKMSSPVNISFKEGDFVPTVIFTISFNFSFFKKTD